MKTYKEIREEILSEGHNRYPGDDMTMKELKIACNAAKNIIEMLEDGAELQRWQISAIVVASDELASVCTSMRVDHDEQMEDEMEMEYDEYGYPSMFGEEVGLDEAQIDKMKFISKGFSTRPAAERHNDSLVGKNKASHQSYVYKHEDGKHYVVDLK